MPALKLKRILWAGLLASNLMLVIISFFLSPQSQNTATDNFITYVLMGMGALMLVFSFVIPKLISKAPQQPGQTPEQMEITTFILGLALNESASIMAFILKFIQHDTNNSLILFAISIGLFIGRFPKEV
jgi:F0F1-type ATP synthase membrane subunit c/vacuolar-type H+-ATPase subunit K